MSTHNTVSFTRMDEGTVEDYALLEELEAQYKTGLVDRLLARMEALDEGLSGYRISRLDHSLQTASRARNEGADTDWIVAALLHDLGDELAPQNHDTLAASIIAPYVREECSWAVRHHGIFQFKYYGDKVGLDPDAREKYRGQPHFDATVHFCEAWDQLSFDPDYTTDSLGSFRPELEQVFSRPAWDDAFLQPGFVTRFATGGG